MRRLQSDLQPWLPAAFPLARLEPVGSCYADRTLLLGCSCPELSVLNLIIRCKFIFVLSMLISANMGALSEGTSGDHCTFCSLPERGLKWQQKGMKGRAIMLNSKSAAQG